MQQDFQTTSITTPEAQYDIGLTAPNGPRDTTPRPSTTDPHQSVFAGFDQHDRYAAFVGAAMMLLPLLGGYFFSR
jgi:hypothetical protein